MMHKRKDIIAGVNPLYRQEGSVCKSALDRKKIIHPQRLERMWVQVIVTKEHVHPHF